MTHELKDIIKNYRMATSQGISCVLVTVVALNGSSYRKPGVRMLLDASGRMTGAVSGGCVEKEIQRQAQSVFKNHQSVMMTYDGRYRIGCEGLLYILLESFAPNTDFIQAFYQAIEKRSSISLHSYYQTTTGTHSNMGTEIILDQLPYTVSDTILEKKQSCYSQVLPPCFRLYISGVEHDAQQLCQQAAMLGWEVIVLKSLDQLSGSNEFPAALQIVSIAPTEVSQLKIDTYTAFVLMSHNFARDLNYLIQLSFLPAPLYIGVLGSKKRMEQLFSDLFERQEELTEDFLATIQGPAGLDIHAITPQEIAISILAQLIKSQRSLSQTEPSSHALLAHES